MSYEYLFTIQAKLQPLINAKDTNNTIEAGALNISKRSSKKYW